MTTVLLCTAFDQSRSPYELICRIPYSPANRPYNVLDYPFDLLCTVEIENPPLHRRPPLFYCTIKYILGWIELYIASTLVARVSYLGGV